MKFSDFIYHIDNPFLLLQLVQLFLIQMGFRIIILQSTTRAYWLSSLEKNLYFYEIAIDSTKLLLNRRNDAFNMLLPPFPSFALVYTIAIS